jgi:hypothetical protein
MQGRLAGLRGRRSYPTDAAATRHDDGAMEQAMRGGPRHMMHNGNPARRFARDRHLRIAAERSNVPPHPLQRGELIEKACWGSTGMF